MRDWYRGCASAFQADEGEFESPITLQKQCAHVKRGLNGATVRSDSYLKAHQPPNSNEIGMNKALRIKQCLEYCEYAAERLRNAGFKLNYTSMKSEACYYEHPARKGYTIRVAAHRYGRTEDRRLPHHIGKTIACITFSPGCYNEAPRSWDSIDTKIYFAVGQYFVKDLPARLRDDNRTLRRMGKKTNKEEI